jgi:hypothetical protein
MPEILLELTQRDLLSQNVKTTKEVGIELTGQEALAGPNSFVVFVYYEVG